MLWNTGRRLWLRCRVLLRRHWRDVLRLRQKIRISEEAIHLSLAAGVGVLGGIVNLVFFLTSDALKEFLFHTSGDWADIAGRMNPWYRVLPPAAGGLVAGGILYWGLKIVGMPGSSNLLEVVVAGDGRLHLRTGLIKALSSLLSINTGGSVGREGPLIHLSATVASRLGQLFRWPPYRLRLLVACGAAAGMAAAYNAPISGAVFAAMIVLGSFSMNVFAPLVLASVMAAMISRSFFGLDPWYRLPAHLLEFPSLLDLPWFLVLGFLAGVLGAAFLSLLRTAEDWFARLPAALPARMAAGGLAVGLIAVAFPQVWGNGYGPTSQILGGEFSLQFLAGLLLAKLIATGCTIGSGAVGGVLTPTLFLGAALGGLFGGLLHRWELALDVPVAAFSLVGMGGMLAATTHSILLAMILGFEICLRTSLMPPLMVGCVVATIVARGLHRESVYSEPLRRRGIELDRDSPRLGATAQTVGDLMRPPIRPVKQTDRFHELVDRFLTSPNNYLPVVDGADRLVGLIALHDLKQYFGSGAEFDGVIAYDVMRPSPPCLTPDLRLVDALPVLLASEQRNVPVVNTLSENRLVGSVVRAEALGILSEAITAPAVSKS